LGKSYAFFKKTSDQIRPKIQKAKDSILPPFLVVCFSRVSARASFLRFIDFHRETDSRNHYDPRARFHDEQQSNARR